MSQETTEARRLTLAAQEALAAAFPGVTFTVETGHIKTRVEPEPPILRGIVEWVGGPPVAYVQDVIHNLTPRYVSGNWKLVCLRWYSPAWAQSMAEHHGARVKVSTYGYSRDTALLHPFDRTPEAEAEIKAFRATLDFCLAPISTTVQRRTT